MASLGLRSRLVQAGLLALGAVGARAQIVSDSLLIDGRYRVFHYHQPSTPDVATPGLRLMFVLHGSGGTGRGMLAGTTALARQAAGERVLAVYPDGYGRYWNECRRASPALANTENLDEQAFFTGMIRYFGRRYAADTTAVFAVGTSGGGHMAYKLALTLPRPFRAVTAIVANLPDAANLDCTPAGVPVAVLIVNGTADPVNPYNGGLVNIGNGVTMGTVRSTEQTLAYWAGLAGYRGQPRRETLPDRDPTDGKTVERYTYRGRGKPDVVLLKVVNGTHDYPRDVDVHEEALRFFLRQRNQP